MAKIYKGKDKYLAKSEAKYFFRILGLVILPLFIIWLLLQITSEPMVIVGASLILVLLLISVGKNLFDRLMYKSRLFFKGRAGEGEVGKILKNLSDDFAIFQSLIINGKRGDIDYVVIGTTGIFVIEVKSHGGKIYYNGEGLTINGKPSRKDFVGQALRNAFNLKKYLRKKLNKNFFINSMLVFSNDHATVNIGPKPINSVHVIHKDSLLESITSNESVFAGREKEIIESALKLL